jgi:hypothetical protein
MTADLALAAEPGFLERSADPAEFVIQACERAKIWLAEALEHGEIDQIVEVKAQAEAIRVYTMQKQLGKDAELSAREIVIRAERGIGLAIRRGQEAGEIRGPHKGRLTNQPGSTELIRSPTEFASTHELNGSGSSAGIYEMTDNVPDGQFEEAVEEAKAEGNLSRANVVRKIRTRDTRREPPEWLPDPGDNHGAAPAQRRKLIRAWAEQGYSSRQMSELLGMRDDGVRKIARETGVTITADAVIAGTRTHDSNRIVGEAVHALEGLAMSVQLVNPDDLDPAQIGDWLTSLTSSIRVLNRLIKTMKETSHDL